MKSSQLLNHKHLDAVLLEKKCKWVKVGAFLDAGLFEKKCKSVKVGAFPTSFAFQIKKVSCHPRFRVEDSVTSLQKTFVKIKGLG